MPKTINTFKEIAEYLYDLGIHDFRIFEIKYDSETKEESFLLEDTWEKSKDYHDYWFLEMKGVSYFKYDSGDSEFILTDYGFENNEISLAGTIGGDLTIKATDFKLKLPEREQSSQNY